MTEGAPLIKLVYEVQNIGIVAGRLMKCPSKLSGEKMMKKISWKRYLLKNKNTPLLQFDFHPGDGSKNGDSGRNGTVEIGERFSENAALFPKDLSPEASGEMVMQWIKSRRAPKNRWNIWHVFSAIGKTKNPLQYVDAARGMSLNDSFWITEYELDEKWEDCHLYNHPFAKELAGAALFGHSCTVEGKIFTPELTTGGVLPKCWIRENGKILLIKMDRHDCGDGQSQAVNEYLASQVAAVMGIPHVGYTLKQIKRPDGIMAPACVCELFTSEKTGFCNAGIFFQRKYSSLRRPDLAFQQLPIRSRQAQNEMASFWGSRCYADMMVYDAVIGNRDRHLGNFGYLVDNDTGEFLRPAPLFDNGRSILYDTENVNFMNVESFIDSLYGQRGKFLLHDAAVWQFAEPRHMEMLERVRHIHLEAPVIGISTTRLRLAEQMLHLRAERIMKTLEYKEKGQPAPVRWANGGL